MKDAIAILVQERQRLLAELRKRAGVEAFPSCANFMLIRTERSARELFDALYAQGVLVRDVSSYPMLERVLRISVGKPEENNRFLEALDRALEKVPAWGDRPATTCPEGAYHSDPAGGPDAKGK